LTQPKKAKGAPKAELYMPSGESEIPKISKLLAKYVEFSEFAQADFSKGYFCASCIYFWEGHDDCAIVYSKGESADGETSDRIAPYAMCDLWKPNWDVIRSKKQPKPVS
jgi:hypothetical protein